jgi:hypothetical protein
MSHELSRQEALDKAAELEKFAADLRIKFDESKKLREKDSWWHRFTSRDRKYFWSMPAWLWMPTVALLVALLLFALRIVGGHLAA